MSLPWFLIVGGVAMYYVSHGISTIKNGMDDITTHAKRNKSADSSSSSPVRSICAGAGKVGTGIAVVGIGCWLGKVALMKPKAAYRGMLDNMYPDCSTSSCEDYAADNVRCDDCGGIKY